MKELENLPETGDITITGENLPIVPTEEVGQFMTVHNPSDELEKVHSVISNIGGNIHGEQLKPSDGSTISSGQFEFKKPSTAPLDDPKTWARWNEFRHKEQEKEELKHAA